MLPLFVCKWFVEMNLGTSELIVHLYMILSEQLQLLYCTLCEKCCVLILREQLLLLTLFWLNNFSEETTATKTSQNFEFVIESENMNVNSLVSMVVLPKDWFNKTILLRETSIFLRLLGKHKLCNSINCRGCLKKFTLLCFALFGDILQKCVRGQMRVNCRWRSVSCYF